MPAPSYIRPSFQNGYAKSPAQQVGKELRRMRAEEASPEERARLWPLVTALYSGYADYQQKTTREIPLRILRPVD